MYFSQQLFFEVEPEIVTNMKKFIAIIEQITITTIKILKMLIFNRGKAQASIVTIEDGARRLSCSKFLAKVR